MTSKKILLPIGILLIMSLIPVVAIGESHTFIGIICNNVEITLIPLCNDVNSLDNRILDLEEHVTYNIERLDAQAAFFVDSNMESFQPHPISGMSVNDGYKSSTITWNYGDPLIRDITHFVIEFDGDIIEDNLAINSTSYTFDNLVNGETYTGTITPVNSYSDEVVHHFTIKPTNVYLHPSGLPPRDPLELDSECWGSIYYCDYRGPPLPPYNLRPTIITDTRISFAWDWVPFTEIQGGSFLISTSPNVNEDNGIGYGSSGGNPANGILLRNLLPDTTYYVKSFNGFFGPSLSSETITIKTPDEFGQGAMYNDIPINVNEPLIFIGKSPMLSLQDGWENTILLRVVDVYNGNSENISYFVETSIDGENWEVYDSNYFNNDYIEINSLNNDQEYHIRVSTVNDAGTSEPSDVLLVTPNTDVIVKPPHLPFTWDISIEPNFIELGESLIINGTVHNIEPEDDHLIYINYSLCGELDEQNFTTEIDEYGNFSRSLVFGDDIIYYEEQAGCYLTVSVKYTHDTKVIYGIYTDTLQTSEKLKHPKPPYPVENITVDNIGSDFVELSWDIHDNIHVSNPYPVISEHNNHHIQYSIHGESKDTRISINHNATTSVLMNDLFNGTTYSVFIGTVSAYGTSYNDENSHVMFTTLS